MFYHKKHPIAFVTALVLMPVYLFIVVLHLFFVPGFRENRAITGKSAYKINTQLVYYLVRNDRSTFSESKNTKIVQKKKTHSGLIVLPYTSPVLNVIKHRSSYSQFPRDDHHSWLSNRILRI